MANVAKKILVLTSGGDAPGMNAAIRAVVRTGFYYGYEMLGCIGGFTGLIEQNIVSLNPSDVGNIIQRGGTMLKTGRCEAFLEASVRRQCYDFLMRKEIAGLIVLGGNGSFRGAALLAQFGGLQVLGIPCTIDNDIEGTHYCIGFDTARNTALEAIDRIRDTASSHNRDFIVEVMGRHTGFLAVDVGIAGGAETILIPEFPMTSQELVDKITRRQRQKQTAIMIVAEASEKPGRSMVVAAELKQLGNLDYKVCILGHTQRGGSPSVLDRKLATQMGAAAVQLFSEGASEQMINWVNERVGHCPFPSEAQGTRYFSDVALLQLNDIICE